MTAIKAIITFDVISSFKIKYPRLHQKLELDKLPELERLNHFF